jgi:hypothetical protein
MRADLGESDVSPRPVPAEPRAQLAFFLPPGWLAFFEGLRPRVSGEGHGDLAPRLRDVRQDLAGGDRHRGRRSHGAASTSIGRAVAEFSVRPSSVSNIRVVVVIIVISCMGTVCRPALSPGSCAGDKAAEPRRAAYGRASRRGTAAAAAGGTDGPFDDDADAAGVSGLVDGRSDPGPGKGPPFPPQAGARARERRPFKPRASRAPAPRRPEASGSAAFNPRPPG